MEDFSIDCSGTPASFQGEPEDQNNSNMKKPIDESASYLENYNTKGVLNSFVSYNTHFWA